jgi:hypothetical protein
LPELGLRLATYGVGFDPHRVVFLRPGAQGTCLALTLGAEHIEVALELSAEGLGAAQARLGDPGRALELAAALEALPEQFAICVTGDRSAMAMSRATPSELPGTAASRASIDEVRALIDRARRNQQTLWLGWSISRLVALENASLLDDQLEDALVALGVVFGMLADAAAPALPGQSDRGDRRDRHAADDDATGGKRRARARDRERERDRERDGAPNGAGKRARDGADATAPGRSRKARSGVGEASVGPLRTVSRGRRVRSGDACAPIEKGVRVRVLEGPFAGKAGVVHELDCKGGARVMLGLLAIRLAVENLTTVMEGRVRPRLSSSHRRPLPVRS